MSIALLGPGVPAIETANARADASQARLAAAIGTYDIATPDIIPRVKVRPAREGDATALAAQMKTVVDEGRWLATESDRPVDDLVERFHSAIQDDQILFVLEADEQIVGAISLQPTGVAGVSSLGMSILREYRGQGWGRELVAAALDAARSRGVVKVTLEVWPDNGRAIALYASSGFDIEGYRRNHYPRLDGSRRSTVMMAKFL